MDTTKIPPLGKKYVDVFVVQILSKSFETFINKESNISTSYNKEGHYTPIQLIHYLSKIILSILKHQNLSPTKEAFYINLLKECTGWIENETIIEEE